MHSTGIEPVSTPWKGAILPLNYECFWTTVHCYRRMFFWELNAVGGRMPPHPLHKRMCCPTRKNVLYYTHKHERM